MRWLQGDDRLPTVTPLGVPADGARPALAAALSIVAQAAASWRAIVEIGAGAEDDAVAEALIRAAEEVGAEPEESLQFLRERLVHETVEGVLT